MIKKIIIELGLLSFLFMFFFSASVSAEVVNPNITFNVKGVNENFTVSIFEDEDYTTQVGKDLTILSGGTATMALENGLYYYKASAQGNNSYKCTDGDDFEVQITNEGGGSVLFEIREDDWVTPVENVLIYSFREDKMPGPGVDIPEEHSSGYTDEDGKLIMEDFEEGHKYWYVFALQEVYFIKDAKFEITGSGTDDFKIILEGQFNVEDIDKDVEIGKMSDAYIIRPLRWDGEATTASKYPSEPGFYHWYYTTPGNQSLVQFQIGKVSGGEVFADFSPLGASTTTAGIDLGGGYWKIEWDWYVDGGPTSMEGPFHAIDIWHSLGETDHNIGRLNVSDFNPFTMIEGLDGDTTDWENVNDDFDFTAAEDLVFHKDGVGKLTVDGPVNLTERETAENLAELAQHLTIDSKTVTLDTSKLIAFAGKHGAAELEIYNLNFIDTPSVMYVDGQGNEEVVVDEGDIINFDLIEEFTWDVKEGRANIKVKEWSTYEVFGQEPLESIEVTTQPQLKYNSGDKLDLTKLKITETYFDGNTIELTFGDVVWNDNYTANPTHGTELSDDDDGKVVTITHNIDSEKTSDTDPLSVKKIRTKRTSSSGQIDRGHFIEKEIHQIRGGINSIREIIKNLQKLLSNIGSDTSLPEKNDVVASDNDCLSFDFNLSLGMRSKDIKCLQEILNKNDFILAQDGSGSKGKETSFFGELTRQAVIKFQEHYKDEILSPIGLKQGTGFVGAMTRAKLNKLLIKENLEIPITDETENDLENGSEFTNERWGRWSATTDWTDVMVGDFTGNGKSDIAGRNSDNGDWWIAALEQ